MSSLAKNSFGKIAASWTVLVVTGVYAFVLSKKSVDKHRYESLQVRNRMRNANVGDYETNEHRRFGG